MCRFASFVLTKDDVYFSDKTDSHTEICNQFHLKEDNHRNEPQLLMCELLPTTDLDDFDTYECTWDQDIKPDWFIPEIDEKRVREAMNERFPAGTITPVAETVDASGCTGLTELKADAAKTVYASGCTALTELKADAAEYVDARGCTALTELKADAAKTVDASGCTALTELKADAAEYVGARGCDPKLVIKAKKGCTIIR